MKNLNNLKYKELYAWYENREGDKTNRAKFSARVLRYGISKEEAILNKSFLSEGKLRMYGSIIDDKGRVCTKCGEYKERDKFANNASGVNKHTCDCKECRNKRKADYRKRTQYAKDHEYKIKKRKLNAGDQIYFQDDIREVISYRVKKGYLVKSILNGTEREISTSDNHYKPNNKCVRYKKLIKCLDVETKEQIRMKEAVKEEMSVNENLWDR